VPGPDGLFCTSANDDAVFNFYTAPGTVTVRNVTGSYNFARTGEYAAWVERDNTTNVDTVMVQAPNAISGIIANFFIPRPFPNPPLLITPPAPVALYTSAGGSNVVDILEGGECLLSKRSTYRVDCKPGGLGSASGATTYLLPSAAYAASLSSDGTLLGWIENFGGAPRLHVRSSGADHVFGTIDDTEAIRVAPGVAQSGELTIEPGHLVFSETYSSGSTYWLLHWSAGPDGVFDDTPGADDTVSRVLPSSVLRRNPTLLAGGLVAYSVDGSNGADVAAVDLSTYRWETLDGAGIGGLATNGAGTLFFHRGYSGFTARLPNGTEQQGGFHADRFAAAGANLVTVQGSTVNLRRRSGGAWFGTPIPLYTGATGTPWDVAVGDQYLLLGAIEGSLRYRVSDLSAASPTTTLLPTIPGTSPNGYPGVSSRMAAYMCGGPSGWNLCVHHPGPDGLYGTPDDVAMVVNRPSTSLPYNAWAVVVSGDKVAFRDENGNITVAGTGPDGVFNTADDTEDVLGPAESNNDGSLALAGDYVAWFGIAAANDGGQVMVADLAKGTQRQATTHYSIKEQLAVDPSGRVTWIDYAFSAPAIFLYAP
jgi:hypothetical protein